ncbi:MAG: IS200/IS605 family transposase [Pirellulales bacterium]|nr:IS200/IS605 family transposase [Pirellulales bacterium]
MSTYTNLIYHLVFSTKNRIPLIKSEIQGELYAYIGGIVKSEGGNFLEIGGIADHVHILLRIKPIMALAQMLNRIKANSSRWLNEEKFKLRKFAWQEGYSAFTVSESQIPIIRNYIRKQAEHHRKKSFQEELLALLVKNNIAYDERYLWK